MLSRIGRRTASSCARTLCRHKRHLLLRADAHLRDLLYLHYPAPAGAAVHASNCCDDARCSQLYAVFIGYSLIWVAATVEESAGYELHFITNYMENAKGTFAFCPMLAFLFVDTRMLSEGSAFSLRC